MVRFVALIAPLRRFKGLGCQRCTVCHSDAGKLQAFAHMEAVGEVKESIELGGSGRDDSQSQL